MEIFLALLRTLVFVVATVAATVYVGRRIGRGRPLLWTGTTLLALNWLVQFGWASYLSGTPLPDGALAGWIIWAGYLLPFLAALAYIWGIGQAAGFPARPGADAGVRAGQVTATTPPAQKPAAPSTHPPAAATEPEHEAHPASTAQSRLGLGLPHAVPIVTEPSAPSRPSPVDPDPVADLGPEQDATPSTGSTAPDPTRDPRHGGVTRRPQPGAGADGQ